jgi:hypothetical protein
MNTASTQPNSKVIGCAFFIGGWFLYFVSAYLVIGLFFGEDLGHLSSLGASSGAGAMILGLLGSPLYFASYSAFHSIFRKRKTDIGINELHSMIASALCAAVILCVFIGAYRGLHHEKAEQGAAANP